MNRHTNIPICSDLPEVSPCVVCYEKKKHSGIFMYYDHPNNSGCSTTINFRRIEHAKKHNQMKILFLLYLHNKDNIEYIRAIVKKYYIEELPTIDKLMLLK